MRVDVIQRGRRELERSKSGCDTEGRRELERVRVDVRGGESWKGVRVDVIQRGRRELERSKSGCDTEGKERVGKK